MGNDEHAWWNYITVSESNVQNKTDFTFTEDNDFMDQHSKQHKKIHSQHIL